MVSRYISIGQIVLHTYRALAQTDLCKLARPICLTLPAVSPVAHGLFNTLSCSPTLRMEMISPAISKVIRNLFAGRASQMFFLPSIFLTRRLGCFGLSPNRVSALRTLRFLALVSFSYACSNCSVKRTSTAMLYPQDTSLR